MRVPTEARRQRPRRRVGLIVVAVVAFFLISSLRGVAGFYTTYLWFEGLGLSSVWTTMLGTKVLLVVAFSAVFFLLLFVNLVLADRLAPRFRPVGPQDEIVQRYRQLVGRHTGKVRLVVALAFALLAGTGVSAQWNNWLLFRNSVDFGINDPQFGEDVSFYVFKLPFLSFLVTWAFMAMVVVTVVTVCAHYLNGGIRLQAPGQRVMPHVKLHISVLLGVLALIKAAGYWLQRYELNFSTRGVVDGASYTDIHAQLRALYLLMFISIAAFGLFIWNVRRQGWVLPIIGVGLWALISVIVGAAIPAFMQKFIVEPAEIRKERPYIERNIKATRAAFGVDQVEQTSFAYDEKLDAAGLARNAETVRNVRLWDPQFVRQTFQKLQEIRSYYRFNDVDIDRYMIDGNLTQTIISGRELNPTDLPGSESWVNRHLSYTHGFGALLAPANAVTPDGKPDFKLRNIPPEGSPDLTQPRIYYGENMGSYAIVNSKQQEIDFQRATEGTTVFSRYDGSGGVRMSSSVRKVAFALRFGNLNPLISDLITSNSRAIYIRDIGERVRSAAPFLRYDSDPYPVILDGRVVWIQDAYTTTNRYPYAQRANVDRVPRGSGLRGDFNYVRNSVKVAIDAFDGEMTFYVVDEKDPLVRAYSKAFPKLFTPGSRMPEALKSHLRYPEDLFRVQTNMYGRYHITGADDFYNAGDAWNISQDPGSGSPTGGQRNRREHQDPTYLLLRLPGDREESFLILQPFVPSSAAGKQQNLTAFMTAKSDPEEYGKLQAFIMPRGVQIDGPALVDARISADPEISRQITLLNQQGSEVLLGNVLLVPIENSLLSIRPLYVQSARNPLPEFKKAILVFGNKAVIADSLQQALTSVFGTAPETLEQQPGTGLAPPPPGPSPGPSAPPAPSGPTSERVRQLLEQAQRDYDAAQAALRNGDLAEYERRIKAVGEALVQARQASGGGTPPPPSSPA